MILVFLKTAVEQFLIGKTMRKSKKLNIQPLFDNVLIEPLEEEEKTPSGIVLPDTAKEKPQKGIVRAVGPGATNNAGKIIPMKIKTGQKVVYKKWGGNEIKIKEKEWLLVEQKDILAIISS